MRYAVNVNGFISNIIIAKPEQKEELESSLGAVLEDASIYNLQIGDLWVEGTGWTRNINGEQIVLQEVEPQEPVEDRVTALEEENSLLNAQVKALSDQNDFQEELIVELANIVYA